MVGEFYWLWTEGKETLQIASTEAKSTVAEEV